MWLLWPVIGFAKKESYDFIWKKYIKSHSIRYWEQDWLFRFTIVFQLYNGKNIWSSLKMQWHLPYLTNDCTVWPWSANQWGWSTQKQVTQGKYKGNDQEAIESYTLPRDPTGEKTQTPRTASNITQYKREAKKTALLKQTFSRLSQTKQTTSQKKRRNNNGQ